MAKTGEMMWIPWIEPEKAEGDVAEMYEKVRQARGSNAVPATALVFSLRPRAGIAKDDLRNAIVDDNTLGAERTELVNIAVSGLNACSFCASAHASSLIRQGTNPAEAVALYRDWHGVPLGPQDKAMLEYSEKLTFAPWSMTDADLDALRDAGFSEENIVDIVLVAAYRNFINRVHIALGLSPESMRERLGGVLDEIVAETETKRAR